MHRMLDGRSLELQSADSWKDLGLTAPPTTVTTTPDGRKVVPVDIQQVRYLLVERRSPSVILETPLLENEVGLWEFDLDTQFTRWNTHMYRLTGVSTPVPATKWLEYVHPEDRPFVERTMNDTFKLGRFASVPHRFQRPDGQIVWLLTFGKVLRDEHDKPIRIVGGTIDASDQRGQEQMLSTARRLESVGQMTAGITHNLNNLLSVILPSLDVAETVVVGETREAIGEARDAALHAKELIRSLMTFSRPNARKATSERVDALVGRVVSMVRRFFEASIHVEFTPACEQLEIQGDLTQLEQAVMNLLVNARDALRDAGTTSPVITVTTSMQSAIAPSGAVSICVRDNGPGIPADVQERLFEPFFTTKAPGRGTGLGLSTVLSTVQQHGGSVRFSSNTEGTVFEVALPAAAPGKTTKS